MLHYNHFVSFTVNYIFFTSRPFLKVLNYEATCHILRNIPQDLFDEDINHISISHKKNVFGDNYVGICHYLTTLTSCLSVIHENGSNLGIECPYAQ